MHINEGKRAQTFHFIVETRHTQRIMVNDNKTRIYALRRHTNNLCLCALYAFCPVFFYSFFFSSQRFVSNLNLKRKEKKKNALPRDFLFFSGISLFFFGSHRSHNILVHFSVPSFFADAIKSDWAKFT